MVPLTQTATARPLPYLSFTQTKGFSTPTSPHLIPRPRLSGLTVPHSNQALLPSMEKRGRERGDVKAEAGGGARQPGNVGQGGWRGSGLGGSQPQRAAASALGNIVFSWPMAQDVHSALAPPPTQRQRSCTKAKNSWRDG